eukprot:gene10905-7563_t
MSLETLISDALAGDTADNDTLQRFQGYSLLEVSKAMKNDLCNPHVVGKAVHLLVKILMNAKQPSRDEIFLVTQYVCNVYDPPAEALKLLGPMLCKIVQQGITCDIRLFELLFQLIRKVDIQKQSLEIRRIFFSVLSFLLEEENVRECGSAELEYLLNCMDGERSPELVLQFFCLARKLTETAVKEEFSKVESAYFESISSYFPIVFSKPPGCSVTKQELQDALRDVMSHPVFGDVCIPFLLSKMVSPSVNVKKDAMRTLRSCIASFSSCSIIQMREVLLMIRTEALKSIRQSGDTVDFVSECTAVLRTIGEGCEEKDSADIISLFDVLMEEAMSNEDDRPACQLYATMFFHLLTGCWKCCASLSVYFFSTMLSKNFSPNSVNSFILMSSFLASVVDAIVQMQPELSIYVKSLERIKKPMEELVLSVISAIHACHAEDEFLLSCQTEFLFSFLQFQCHLGHWASEETVEAMLLALLQVCAEPHVCSQRGKKQLCRYASLDWAAVKNSLSKRNLCAASSPAADLHDILSLIGSSSSGAAVFVVAQTSPSDRGSLAVHVLSALEEGLTDEDADNFLFLLREGEGHGPHHLEALCRFFGKAPDSLVKRVTTAVAQCSAEEAAALLSCGRPEMEVSTCDVEPLLTSFLSLLSTSSRTGGYDRLIALNGLLGCLLCSTALASDVLQDIKRSDGKREGDTERCLCFLWANALRRDVVAMDEDEAKKCWLTILLDPLQGDAEEETAAAVTGAACAYLDFQPLVTRTTKNASHTLLPCLVQHAAALVSSPGATVARRATVWEAVRRLIERETEDVVRRCTVDLLDVLRAHASLPIEHGPEAEWSCKCMTFSVLAALHAKYTSSEASHSREWSHYIATDGALEAAVFAGLKTPRMQDRCTALELLQCVAESFATMKKPLPMKFKAKVLVHTIDALGDHKRKVRQAAAQCRHMWFLAK